AALDIARGSADGLDQRRARTEITLLVGVQDRHQGTFGDVETFAQQVDADQNVEDAKPQVADNLDPLKRIDVRMHVAHPDAVLVQVFGKRLRHLLGERGDQHALAPLGAVVAFRHEIVDLVLYGPHDRDGIDETRGPYHLLD